MTAAAYNLIHPMGTQCAGGALFAAGRNLHVGIDCSTNITAKH